MAICVVAGASTQAGAQPLTIEAALAEAAQGNPELAALGREHEAARLRGDTERFLAPPVFETQIWQWPVRSINPADAGMFMFMGEQELPGRGKRALRQAVRARDAEVVALQIAARRQEILADVRMAFVDLAQAREVLDILAAQERLLREMADAATLRYAASRTGPQDTLKAVLEIARLQEEVVTTGEQGRLAEARLNGLMGRQADAPVGALAPLAGFNVLPAAADVQRLALERQPELARARVEAERERAELARIRSERSPDFVIGGGYMLMPGEAGAWTARAGLTWPNAPWARGRVAAQVAEQEKRVEAASARLDAAESRVRVAVQEALVRLAAARDRADLLQTSVLPQIEQSLDVARVAYQADRGGLLDLVDTHRALLASRIDYVRARSDAERAATDLERAIGSEPAGTSLLVRAPVRHPAAVQAARP
jgi:cobalt-zinc-cadmium efflux system outer membrane protein